MLIVTVFLCSVERAFLRPGLRDQRRHAQPGSRLAEATGKAGA
jgi:hypothetical protein